VVKRPKWPWIALVLMQLIQALSLVPWLPMAGFAVMAFDAPGSDKMWQPWMFVLGIWSYPLWLLAAGAISWLLFAFRHHVAAVVLCAVFTLPMPAAARDGDWKPGRLSDWRHAFPTSQ
jgi:hypothetical protein